MFTTYLHLKIICVGIDSICCDKQVISYRLLTVILLKKIKVFKKKYPAGVLTNTTLPDFFENELTIITDHWLDKNALNDTLRVNKKVLMVCDTNNFSKGADQIIIGNNKGAKSLGVIFYLLTRGFCKAKKMDVNIPDLEYWTGERE